MAFYCDVIFALAVLSLFEGVWSSPIHQDRCYHVRQSFQTHLTRSEYQTSLPIKNICPHMSTGCCANLEKAIESKTRLHFSDQITSHLESFRLQFVQRESRIRHRLNAIFNETVEKVNQKYPLKIAQSNEVLIKFISQNVFQAQRVHSHWANTEFYVDQLVNAIVVNELENLHDITPDYANCLSSVKFSDILVSGRDKISKNLHNVIETSRLILQSFQLSSELLSRSEKVKLNEDCVRRLAHDFHCGACADRDLAATRVCGSTCRATISSCITSSLLATVSESWKGLSHSLNQLVDSVVVHRNPEVIFATYPSLIEQIVKQARSKSEIPKKARVSCGPMHLKNQVNENSILNYTTEHHYSSATERFSESLFVSIQSMAHLWSYHKDIFDNLPQKFCQNYADKDCLDNRSSLSAHSALALPLVNHSAVQVDEFYERVKHFQNNIGTIKIKLSNRTVYTYDEDSNSPNSLLAEGSGGSGDRPDEEPDDPNAEGDYSGSEPPIDETTSEASSTNGWIFDTTAAVPRDTDTVVHGTGSSGCTLQASFVLLVSLLMAVFSLRLRP